MFFYLSKLVWLVIQPTSAMILALLLGLLLLVFRRRRFGIGLITAASLGLFIGGFAPLGAILVTPLEERFPQPVIEGPVTGIIVLGGAVNPHISEPRGSVALVDSAERMTEAVALARRYPEARIIFSGGTAEIFPGDLTESQSATRFFTEMGVEPGRVTLEGKSRNTAENAAFTRALVTPQPGERWLLVTSAYHMPRAVGCFRAVGFPIVPWPVDYRTDGRNDEWQPNYIPARGLELLDVAVREWIGLAAYRLTGRTDALLPGPQ